MRRNVFLEWKGDGSVRSDRSARWDGAGLIGCFWIGRIGRIGTGPKLIRPGHSRNRLLPFAFLRSALHHRDAKVGYSLMDRTHEIPTSVLREDHTRREDPWYRPTLVRSGRKK